MTINEAKKDCIKRLQTAGVSFDRVTAKTVSFSDLARSNPVFVQIHGLTINKNFSMNSIFSGLAKPSEGGYVPQLGENVRRVI